MLVIATPTAQAEQQHRTQGNLVERYDRVLEQNRELMQLVGLRKKPCPSLRKAIVHYRGLTWERQDFVDDKRSPTYYPERRKFACAYKRHVLTSWKGQARAYRKLITKLANPTYAILYVFGPHGKEALVVSSCESGRGTEAQNGQYLGMFQMGDYARSRYGHGNTPYEQTKAAYRYFVASGKDWSPWSCKPW